MRYNERSVFDRNGRLVAKLYHSKLSPCTRAFVPHHHTECEIALINSGRGIYSVLNKKYEFIPGDVFLFGGDELHCITEISGGEEFDVTNVHFEPRLIWSQDGIGSTGLLKILFDRSDRFSNRIERENGNTPHIRKAIQNIEAELTGESFEYGILVRDLIAEILITLSRHYGYINNEENARDTARHGHAADMNAVINYIEENLSSDIRLEDLAARCGMNKTYFCSVFRSYNGVSPFDYITVKRIEKAVELIKTTNRTKIDIAQECGFNSMSNFYKAFGRITGKKPGEY